MKTAASRARKGTAVEGRARVDSMSTRKPELGVVPLLGTGFNRWLLEGVDASPILTDWWSLVRFVAWSEGLLPNAILEAKLGGDNDATFAWESVVLAAAERSADQASDDSEDDRPIAAGRVERRLLSALGHRIKELETDLARNERVKQRAQRFAAALTGNGERSAQLVNLNFDKTFGSALGIVELHEPWAPTVLDEATSRSVKLIDPTRVAIVPEHGLQIWHPHGESNDSEHLVLGVHRYARAVDYVVRAFGAFKKAERVIDQVSASVIHATDTPIPFDQQSWVSASINAPLLFLGVGLGRAEIDIWEFLHLRARNHANVVPTQRPKLFRVTCDQEDVRSRDHWRTLSDGIAITELRLGSTWKEAWPLLLDILATGSRLFGAQSPTLGGQQ